MDIFLHSPETNLWKKEKPYTLLRLMEYDSNIRDY